MTPLLTDPSPAGGLVLCALLALAAAGGVALALDRPTDPLDDTEAPTASYASAEALSAAMLPLLALAPRHPLRDDARRLDLATVAVEVGQARRVPPSLLLAVAFRESSWRPDRIGPAGEVGLMQVHPITVRHFRCRALETARGQLDCGARVLRRAADRCGSWRQALHVYASRSQSCRAASRRIEWIGRDRMGIARRMQGGTDAD
jgi:hypothetical protein